MQKEIADMRQESAGDTKEVDEKERSVIVEKNSQIASLESELTQLKLSTVDYMTDDVKRYAYT